MEGDEQKEVMKKVPMKSLNHVFKFDHLKTINTLSKKQDITYFLRRGIEKNSTNRNLHFNNKILENLDDNYLRHICNINHLHTWVDHKNINIDIKLIYYLIYLII